MYSILTNNDSTFIYVPYSSLVQRRDLRDVSAAGDRPALGATEAWFSGVWEGPWGTKVGPPVGSDAGCIWGVKRCQELLELMVVLSTARLLTSSNPLENSAYSACSCIFKWSHRLWLHLVVLGWTLLQKVQLKWDVNLWASLALNLARSALVQFILRHVTTFQGQF